MNDKATIVLGTESYTLDLKEVRDSRGYCSRHTDVQWSPQMAEVVEAMRRAFFGRKMRNGRAVSTSVDAVRYAIENALID